MGGRKKGGGGVGRKQNRINRHSQHEAELTTLQVRRQLACFLELGACGVDLEVCVPEDWARARSFRAR